MKYFESIYLNKEDQWPDHLKCKACGARVERGIANVSAHWVECEGKDFTDKLKELVDASELNIDNIHRK